MILLSPRDSIPLIQFPPLTPSIIMVHLSQLGNQHQSLTIIQTPDFIWIPPAFPLVFPSCSWIQSRQHVALVVMSHQSPWSVTVSPSLFVFPDLYSLEKLLPGTLQNDPQSEFVLCCCFIYHYTGVMGFWREYSRSEVPTRHLMSRSTANPDGIIWVMLYFTTCPRQCLPGL